MVGELCMVMNPMIESVKNSPTKQIQDIVLEKKDKLTHAFQISHSAILG